MAGLSKLRATYPEGRFRAVSCKKTARLDSDDFLGNDANKGTFNIEFETKDLLRIGGHKAKATYGLGFQETKKKNANVNVPSHASGVTQSGSYQKMLVFSPYGTSSSLCVSLKDE